VWGLITVPDYAAIKAADEFKGKTIAINEMRQTDFTYFKIIGCFYDILCILRPDKGSRNEGGKRTLKSHAI
jgi:hypothetical protein